jgi:hypothetical protein
MRNVEWSPHSTFNIEHSTFNISLMTDDQPPILRSWRNLYLAVLGALALEILVFYLFTRAFA